ncbi:hypothetical protein [Leptolyngbya sp. NIES-2104]|uniref:hypothetical protein n=1 Tax=Leptolyngbya sp. NIES-2104 TaxID=1552121 RepID=UPI0006ECB2D4|nr:hypothetical protein [Leptolyngbya sp. NIES-2104]GAP94665.1 hypothetical protein NIES2104_11760 [Leptolyngbya sp. NIES-2104]
MNDREQLLQELEQAPDELIVEILNFVRSTKAQQTELPSNITPIDVAELQKQIPTTPEARSRRLREWVASLPQDSPGLPDEAMHRDTMYD